MKQDWKKKKLGEVFSLEYGKPLAKDKRTPDGLYPVYGANGIIDRANEFYVGARSIIVGRKGSAGEINYTEPKFWPLDVTYYTKFNKKELNIDFLYHLLNLLELPKLAKGVKPGINRNDVYAKTAYIPPLPEQERIVAKLDQYFEAIDQAKANAERNLQNAVELFQSRFSDIFSTRDDSWIQNTLLELLEKGWITSHLDGNHGGDYPRKNEFVESGVPYLSANCLKNGYVDFSKAKFLTKEKAQSLRKGIARNNDVLFAHNATVGPTALLKTDEEKVILSTSLTYYRCNPSYINPEYLLQYLRSEEFIRQYESVMRQSTRNQVPITKQRTFFHLIPPITVQNEIVPKLNKINKELEKIKEIYSKKLILFDELKKSILHKAFDGELTKQK